LLCNILAIRKLKHSSCSLTLAAAYEARASANDKEAKN
jgi:hypothetical protein